MFDTHCHLNFSAFKKNLDKVIENAKTVGVSSIVVPGTDIESSKKAAEIAEKYDGVYAAVGIHPHHIYEIKNLELIIHSLEKLLTKEKVIAMGEVGVDRHIYKITKYENYQVDESFINLQKEFLKSQIQLAIKYDKSLILHNREAKKDLLEVLSRPAVAKALAGRAVFHCCEPDGELLEFAKDHKIFIGVDGDITYRKDKQEFIKRVQPEMLVLETDSPLLLPEPLRAKKLYPNEPKNLKLIAQFISRLIDQSVDKLIDQSTENAKTLFRLPK